MLAEPGRQRAPGLGELNDALLKVISSNKWCAMLVAKVAFPAAVLLLVSLIASDARYHSRGSRDDRPSDRAWEQEQDRYFEQCRFVNAWKEHLGYVSVLAFLDPAWQYSFRQAVMLELLSSRLRKSGFPDIRFFAISPSSDFSMENEGSEEDFEVEAWREIGAKHEMDSLVGDNFLKGNGSEITFLQDDPRSRMWERFRATRDQVIIIDRCGKLTYHVIVPWSILFFPYVKAAILSTYEEDPCGGCDSTIYQKPNHEEHIVKLTKIPDEKEASPTQSETEVNVDTVWTTESLENATLRHKSSSEEERETLLSSTTSSFIPLHTDRSNVATESSMEFTTWYNNNTTESSYDESHPIEEGTRDEEDLMNSESGSTIPSGTVSTFELQARSHPSANNNLLTPANNGDRTLLLDEPITTDETENNSTPTNEETTTSTFVDENQDKNTTLENSEHFGKDTFLPLRIIMYAPHVHKNGRKTKKHAHLILKTGDPGFHEHLDFGVDVASSTNSWQGADSHVTNSGEHDWVTKANADEENANQKYTFDGDESPGLYGEVADYWKSYEDNDITDRNETFNDTYTNSTISYNEEHHTNSSDHATNILEENYSVANVTESSNVESSTDLQNIAVSNIESSRMNNQVSREEEMQYKLTEHYEKLLSWIDYKLSK